MRGSIFFDRCLFGGFGKTNVSLCCWHLNEDFKFVWRGKPEISGHKKFDRENICFRDDSVAAKVETLIALDGRV